LKIKPHAQSILLPFKRSSWVLSSNFLSKFEINIEILEEKTLESDPEKEYRYISMF